MIWRGPNALPVTTYARPQESLRANPRSGVDVAFVHCAQSRDATLFPMLCPFPFYTSPTLVKPTGGMSLGDHQLFLVVTALAALISNHIAMPRRSSQ